MKVKPRFSTVVPFFNTSPIRISIQDGFQRVAKRAFPLCIINVFTMHAHKPSCTFLRFDLPSCITLYYSKPRNCEIDPLIALLYSIASLFEKRSISSQKLKAPQPLTTLHRCSTLQKLKWKRTRKPFSSQEKFLKY